VAHCACFAIGADGTASFSRDGGGARPSIHLPKRLVHKRRLVNLVYDMDTYIFKMRVFTKQVKHA